MIAHVLVGLVILIHLYIVVLEMFFWDKPYGRKVFGNTAEFAAARRCNFSSSAAWSSRAFTAR